MSTVEIKKRLIGRIEDLENRQLLEEMLHFLLLDAELESSMELSSGQKAAIQKGLEDIRTGNVLTDDEANAEIDAWLSE